MPKKFQGENTKSAAARARRAEAKAAADAKKQKELEDAYWKDEDKHVMRKEQRKVSGPRAPRPTCGRGRVGSGAEGGEKPRVFGLKDEAALDMEHGQGGRQQQRQRLVQSP